MQLFGQVGPIAASVSLGQGLPAPLRQGNMGDMIVSKLHGDFYESNYRGTMFSVGSLAATALASTHATATGLSATATPILGLYNPLNSGFNAVLNQAVLNTFINNVTSVAPGAFVWVAATGQSAMGAAGVAPINRKTLLAAGSVCRGFAGASALTGMVGNAAIFGSAPFPLASGLLTTTVAAATPTPSVGGMETYNGSLIVPPGGVIGLMCTLSTTTHSFFGSLVWEEVPI